MLVRIAHAEPLQQQGKLVGEVHAAGGLAQLEVDRLQGIVHAGDPICPHLTDEVDVLHFQHLAKVHQTLHLPQRVCQPLELAIARPLGHLYHLVHAEMIAKQGSHGRSRDDPHFPLRAGALDFAGHPG
nr:hypothetical protein [Aeromonas hydrophila]